MKKRSSSRKAKTRSRDLQLEEFERRDLGDDLHASGMGRIIRPRGRPTSISLDDNLIERLRAKGAKRGLGYQTMLKLIVREHIDEY